MALVQTGDGLNVSVRGLGGAEFTAEPKKKKEGGKSCLHRQSSSFIVW